MSADSIWNALERKLLGAEDFVAGGANPAAVDEAETELSVEFSEDYRKFLVTYGAAMVEPYEFVGLGTAEELSGDTVVQLTRQFQEGGWELNGGYVVGMDHAGNPICVNQLGEVWTYDHDAGERVALATSLGGYLRSLV